jgi:zinc protease
MKELNEILEGVTEEELDFTKQALVQAMGRRFESTRALSSFLDDISAYGYPDDFQTRRLAELMELGTEDLRVLARKHLTPDEMVILVVGDAAHVEPGLAELGYGEVRRLDVDGRPLSRD